MRLQRDNQVLGARYIRLKVDEIIIREPERLSDADDPWLTASIARHGLLQPVLVYAVPETDRYELLAGYRRLAACRAAGLCEIDARVIQGDGAKAAACMLEEMVLVRQCHALCGMDRALYVGEERIAEQSALPHAVIENRFRLYQLPYSVRREMIRHGLTAGQAGPLVHMGHEELQLEAVSVIAQRALSARQASRLMLAAKECAARRSKRRILPVVMDAFCRTADALRARGIPLDVRMRVQEGRILLSVGVKNVTVNGEKEENA